MVSIWTLATVIAATLPGQSAAAGQAAPAPAATGRQAVFDTAMTAAADDRCDAALAAFAQLDAMPAARPNALVEGAVALHRGRCLIRGGDEARGEAQLRAGLAKLDPKGPLAADIALGQVALSRLLLRRQDFEGARQAAEAALAVSDGITRFQPLMLLAQARMFDEGDAAVTAAREALALAIEAKAKPDVRAMVRTIHARALMNAGDAKGALAELTTAMREQGGLDLRVNASDVATRGDLALAASLTGDQEAARKYLAYTGAGRMRDIDFGRASVALTPSCAEHGIDPATRAVVEFALHQDGSVTTAQTIWTDGDRAAAIAFGDAVRNWSWKADVAQQVDPFYRRGSRVELRCSKAGDRDGATAILWQRTFEWLGVTHELRQLSRASVSEVAAARRAIAALPPGDRARMAPLLLLAASALTSEEETRRSWREIAALAERHRAPVPTLALVALRTDYGGETARERALFALRRDPTIAADAESVGAVTLVLADDPDLPAGAVEAVAADPRLPVDSPVRVQALLHMARAAAARRDLAAAQSAFARTGLTEQQCSVIGLTPSLRATNTSSNDFPDEAMQWGFEGWVRTEFDVAADGRTVAPRAIIAYPPMVFNAGAERAAGRFRYERSYMPSGGTACSALASNFRFKMAD